MATVELCSRMFFQLLQVRKYCAPNLTYEMIENTTIRMAMPTRLIQSFISAPTLFVLRVLALLFAFIFSFLLLSRAAPHGP